MYFQNTSQDVLKLYFLPSGQSQTGALGAQERSNQNQWKIEHDLEHVEEYSETNDQIIIEIRGRAWRCRRLAWTRWREQSFISRSTWIIPAKFEPGWRIAKPQSIGRKGPRR